MFVGLFVFIGAELKKWDFCTKQEHFIEKQFENFKKYDIIFIWIF